MVDSPGTNLRSSTCADVPRHSWLTAERQRQVRVILLGITLFVGLVVWIWHSLGAAAPQPMIFVRKLRIVGIMTWLYALVQIVDMRFWHSNVAERRRVSMGIPESIIAWLFAQMLAWFGIVFYGFTEDGRWFVAGLAVLLAIFATFPVRQDH